MSEESRHPKELELEGKSMTFQFGGSTIHGVCEKVKYHPPTPTSWPSFDITISTESGLREISMQEL